MRRLVLAGLAALAAAAALAIVTSTGGAQQPPAQTPPTAVRTITLTEGTGRSKRVDNPPRGGEPSVGDLYVFNTPLYQAGKRVGQTRGVCTVVTSKTFRADCSDTIQLGNGEIYARGIYGSGNITYAGVVGGIGAFNGTQGNMTITETGGGDQLVIRLRG